MYGPIRRHKLENGSPIILIPQVEHWHKMSEDENMTASDIANSKGFVTFFRAFVPLITTLLTILSGFIFAYVRDANSKLTSLATDIDRIKWELPAMKETSKSDREATQREIVAVRTDLGREISEIADRVRTNGTKDEALRDSVSELKIKMATTEQKLGKNP